MRYNRSMRIQNLFISLLLLIFIFAGCDDSIPTLSIESLALKLGENANTDAEKATAIWDYITDNISYDVDTYFSGAETATSAEATLIKGTAICIGYANLFQALAEAMDLQSAIVGGYAKEYSYTEGSVFQSLNHAWNAVQIDGAWQLIDSTWGAGYMDNEGVFVKCLNESWYRTPPEHFIFTHLPEDSGWQLLPSIITKQWFEALPGLNPDFFRWGFTPEQVYAEVGSENYRGLVTQFALSTAREILTIVEAPIGKYLSAGSEYTIVVRIPDSLAVSLYCPESLIWYFCEDANGDLPPYGLENNFLGQNAGIKSQDGTYSFTISPTVGKLKLCDMYNSISGSSQFVLEYTVE